MSLRAFTRERLLLEVFLTLSIGDTEDVRPRRALLRALDLAVLTEVRHAVVLSVATVTELHLAIDVRTVYALASMETHVDGVVGVVLGTDFTDMVRPSTPDPSPRQGTFAVPSLTLRLLEECQLGTVRLPGKCIEIRLTGLACPAIRTLHRTLRRRRRGRSGRRR